MYYKIIGTTRIYDKILFASFTSNEIIQDTFKIL